MTDTTQIDLSESYAIIPGHGIRRRDRGPVIPCEVQMLYRGSTEWGEIVITMPDGTKYGGEYHWRGNALTAGYTKGLRLKQPAAE